MAVCLSNLVGESTHRTYCTWCRGLLTVLHDFSQQLVTKYCTVCLCVSAVCVYCICVASGSWWAGLGANISGVDTAHCPSYKQPPRMTPSPESRGGENSSMIMILLHARWLLRAVLSAGSQHFSSHSPRQITYKERVKAMLKLASVDRK